MSRSLFRWTIVGLAALGLNMTGVADPLSDPLVLLLRDDAQREDVDRFLMMYDSDQHAVETISPALEADERFADNPHARRLLYTALLRLDADGDVSDGVLRHPQQCSALLSGLEEPDELILAPVLKRIAQIDPQLHQEAASRIAPLLRTESMRVVLAACDALAQLTSATDEGKRSLARLLQGADQSIEHFRNRWKATGADNLALQWEGDAAVEAQWAKARFNLRMSAARALIAHDGLVQNEYVQQALLVPENTSAVACAALYLTSQAQHRASWTQADEIMVVDLVQRYLIESGFLNEPDNGQWVLALAQASLLSAPNSQTRVAWLRTLTRAIESMENPQAISLLRDVLQRLRAP